MVAAFSPVALGAATALFIAGCATSFLYLGSPGAVFSTAYGVVLVAKVIGFGAVVAAGYYNWKRVGPRLEAAVGGAGQDPEAQRLLSRAVAAELGAASVVLLLTSILVALPMPAA